VCEGQFEAEGGRCRRTQSKTRVASKLCMSVGIIAYMRIRSLQNAISIGQLPDSFKGTDHCSIDDHNQVFRLFFSFFESLMISYILITSVLEFSFKKG
jgi:hypothetical protein